MRVRLDVPRTARGTYFAGLLVETPRPPGAIGLVVLVRYLVPFIVEIQGRPVRQKVRLHDLEMLYRKADARQPATTVARMRIANEGRTFSRVRGDLRVERRAGERWRPVARVEIPQRGIIPGVTLALGDDLKRRLPSGTYRLRGNLYVDGRRVAPLDKEIAFEGDPDVTGVAFDTALGLKPGQLDLTAVPGATRTTVVQVENPSEDPLRVRVEAVLPGSLRGVALGQLRGEALSAVGWVRVRPAEFTLRPERRQNLRVIMRVPREGVDHANYYADLVFHATYADGQSAGRTRSTVRVANPSVPAAPRVQVDRLTLAHDEATRYLVQVQFANVGNVHVTPAGRVEVLAAGGRVAAAGALSGESGVLLPLGVRRMSAEIDVAALEPDTYLLRASIGYTGGSAVKQMPIRVDTEDGQKVVVIVPEAKAAQTAEDDERNQP